MEKPANTEPHQEVSIEMSIDVGMLLARLQSVKTLQVPSGIVITDEKEDCD